MPDALTQKSTVCSANTHGDEKQVITLYRNSYCCFIYVNNICIGLVKRLRWPQRTPSFAKKYEITSGFALATLQ